MYAVVSLYIVTLFELYKITKIPFKSRLRSEIHLSSKKYLIPA